MEERHVDLKKVYELIIGNKVFTDKKKINWEALITMRAHLEYGLHPREAAPMMGHSLESHQQYSRFFNEEILEDSFERAIKRRKATHTDKS